ncbi:hydrogen peroxide-dependent heme synthase [Microbacterium amylolyticum]|uniref:Coproheme decarboxylase n=1 Tax=Microbacterium amylolyticum TaxID=936337 RepID=A0ABS4ZHC7_9MICO|nr:hydrogen peroxide-dependent heme synthase [Microbacterium amylolyticum]MBP2436689.1 chlorite dismutase [Microbacterium amylolyticum]
MADFVAPSGDNYSLWTVWRRDPHHPVLTDDTAELDALVSQLAAEGVTVRGFYDVSGMRADADLMIWLHGAVPEDLQKATRRLRRTELLQNLLPTWHAMAVHRDAEFNKRHVPGYLRGEQARGWLTVYPFVRSYEWYLLPDAERREMLADHGRKGSVFTNVVANTMASFALGDYEWMLPLESDDLTALVDMMRELRYTEARRHVREEVPFYTGRRIPVSDIAEVLR